MSEKEYQSKCVKLFQRNTVLINELETANNRIAELEAQIEKMKCCYNCAKWNDGQCADVPNDNNVYCSFCVGILGSLLKMSLGINHADIWISYTIYELSQQYYHCKYRLMIRRVLKGSGIDIYERHYQHYAAGKQYGRYHSHPKLIFIKGLLLTKANTKYIRIIHLILEIHIGI